MSYTPSSSSSGYNTPKKKTTKYDTEDDDEEDGDAERTGSTDISSVSHGATHTTSPRIEGEDGEDEEDEVDEDEEDSEDEEDEEDEEPRLKYQRLGANVSEILREDAASCMVVHEKFLGLGTHFGHVYILDFNGNQIKKVSAHSVTVNELSIDDSGDFLASCSDDGRVVITSLYTDEHSEFEFGRPVMTVALDWRYSRSKTKQFACGGRAGQLVLSTKGRWFSSKTTTVLHAGEGPIYAIKWRGPFIAWANDLGVKIYDCSTNQRITYIDRPKDSPRPDQYRCNLCWENDDTLLIGWANTVKIGHIKERPENVSLGLPSKFVEIVACFRTEYWISGLCPFGEYLAILSYEEEEEDDDLSRDPRAPRKVQVQLPAMRIVSRTGEEKSCDQLNIHGYERYKATDYRLDHLASESLFYIVSPKDIVVAKPRDLDDHITWLLERGQFEQALHDAEQHANQLHTHQLEKLGEQYLDSLFTAGEYAKAAAACPRVLKRDGKAWETWIYKFYKAGQLAAVVGVIPVGNPTLSQTVYETVLSHFLVNDHELFLRLITEWPSSAGLYNPATVVASIEERLKSVADEKLNLALASLYTYERNYEKTLRLMLRLRPAAGSPASQLLQGLGGGEKGNVFDLIRKYNLFHSIQNEIAQLMQYDTAEAVKLLVAHTDRIPVATVVAQLRDQPRLLHAYLHGVFEKDVHLASDFHELQVALYADYDYRLLLPFLRQSNYYSLDKAYKLCEERMLYPEMVFILGRMGNTKQALALIIDKLGDVKEAVEFVQSHNDAELWDDLISLAMKNPAFVSALLENIGGHVDPIKLIKRIPEGMKINNLRDRLVKIISDYNLQMSLREGCNVILKADCVDLAERLYRGQRRGLRVEEGLRCSMCSGSLFSSKDAAAGIVVFFCSHVYHERCLKGATASAAAAATPAANGTNAKAAASAAAAAAASVADEKGKQTGQKLVADGERLWCIICHNAQQSKTRRTGRRGTGAVAKTAGMPVGGTAPTMKRTFNV